MKLPLTDAELAAYLDEALPPEAMAGIERAARDDGALLARLAEVSARRDAGVHSLADVWRRHRLSCPTREQWGSYLLGAIDAAAAQFYRFHVETGGCRLCQANLHDLQNELAAQPTVAESRRRKYFQSSAGHLRAQQG